MSADETIVALASGSGRGGVAVIRVSGRQALHAAQALCQVPPPPPRQAAVRVLRDPLSGEMLDEAMVIFMPGPKSFTGEDVAELHVHGGPAVISAVLTAVLRHEGVRPAEPGEFTRRAFEGGKLDLLQAEAVADLVDAETEGQRRQAARIYQGEASRRLDAWRGLLVEAMAALEAAIDFPDEGDVPGDVASSALRPARALLGELVQALERPDPFRAVREGFRIAILGAPNAGKSSLLNRLAGREAAIVSPIAGTTRDIVEVRLVLGGFPVWIADTAGLREVADQIEAEGVRRALERAEEADLRLWVVAADGVEEADRTDHAGQTSQNVSRETLLARFAEIGRGVDLLRPDDILVWTKADLATDVVPPACGRVLAVSSLTGDGIPELIQRLEEGVAIRLGAEEPPLVTRARHRVLMEAARNHLERALAAAKRGLGPELVSEDLRLAARALGQITGAVDVEDLLGAIFSQFCIGK